ncbi:MAG: hypothetical protein JNK09_21395 [Prolixibacteraceae bacterium]|nr:hypothetical protein [Prolixibacteraceae bacterium]
MKKYFLFSALLSIMYLFSFGQAPTAPIEMKKTFGGYLFYQSDERMNMNQLTRAMKANEQAYNEFKTAKSNYVAASIIGGAGGFMIGWPLGAALAGGEANWTMAGIGAGLVAISIPFNVKFNKQVKHAVEKYNEGLKTGSFKDRSEIRFSMTGNGAGMVFRF